MIKKITIWLVFLLTPYLSFSTHIVGGVLNYTYNGGNIYTITLKLYRDCGPSAAAFPGSVTIKVKGNNGANISPSKDLTINLGNITTLSANLLPCAVAPNPIPCVQEGVYSKTISLPANTGGYHLNYQVSARNLSLTNINGACNCIGESFYAYIPNNTVSSNSNSNAVFSLFPPLFICANQPFTFNHSATDADGDSLAYSLYTPYDDNVAPTYSNNIAIFPEVVYLPGYSTNNPLGATPFFLNPLTGVLTGTPNTIGQFVVGVRVKEYRHGVFISQTLRDFQFNVLNCPAPPPTLAISNMTINNGCSVKVTATGITAASSTWRSIYPGTSGTYNNFMSCTSNCLNPTITAVGSPPPYVDYAVCGIATNCLGNNVCDTFRVYFNPPLSVTISPGNPALCNGQTSTTLIAMGTGGTPPYTYLWNNVNPTQTISVGAGTYNIKLTDGSGCPPAYSSAIVSSYSVPVSANAGADKTICVTNPVASLNATISGATGGIWSGGTGTFSPNNTTTSNLFYTPSASELTAGSVTLIVTTVGSGACPSASDAVVVYYSDFTGTATTSTISVSCYGGSNGSASVSLSGGNAPYSYLWNSIPAKTTTSISNLSAGNYSVTITDGIGCQVQRTVEITQPLPIAVNSTLSNVSCFSGSSGSLSVAGFGGSSPYTYSWSPGNQTTASLTGLTAGTYSVKVTDTKSCALTSTFQVTQPASLTTIFSQTNVSCFNGADGQINSSTSGGTSPYSYSWSPGGASATNLSSLGAVTYSLSIKDNLNCLLSKTVTITQPSVLAIAISVTNESCSYLNNGSASAIISGGTPGYTYLWQPGSLSTGSVANLASGNYSVTATDLKGCSLSTLVTITEPTTLFVNLANIQNVSCFGGSNGSVTANVSGGTAAYTYSWSAGAASSASLTNLTSGTYTLLVTDSKSCSATASVAITQPTSLTLSAANTSVTCFGGNNGTSAISANGGTAPYSYFWSPSGLGTSSLSGLSAGTYTSLITDAKGCTISATQSITQSSSLTILFTQAQVSCFNGNNSSMTATVTGGNGPYTYTWSPGNVNAQNISGLVAGTYTLNVKDVFNCANTKTVSVSQSPALVITTSVTNETCNYLNNGTATASVSGGSPGYTFLWQPGSLTANTINSLASGNYSVTATDTKGCSISTVVSISEPALLTVSVNPVSPISCFGGNNGSATAIGSGGTANYSYTWTPGGTTTAAKNNLSQGIYTVTVSDSKSCISQTTLNITQPSSITPTSTISAVSCNGGNNGSITLSLSGGTSPYSYFWLPLGQTTYSVSNLTAGNYSVNITDINSCTTSATYSVTQSSSISIVFTSTQVSCFNGSNGKINASVSGGNSPYSYSWSNAATSQNVTGLLAGTYTLTVTDNFSCSTTKTVSISQPSNVIVTTTVTNETCNYLNNGTALALASGGTAGYTYQWQPGAVNANSLTNLASGLYTVTATDAKGCTNTAVATITEPAALTLTLSSVTDVSCYGGTDGSATVNGLGGTPNYSYTWTPGGTTAAAKNNLSQGIYTVTVSDSKSCISQTTLNITQPSSITLTSTISAVSCNGGNNGSITLSLSGGTSPYSYFWLPLGQTTYSVSNLTAGNYSVNITDINSCTTSATYSVTQSSSISIVFTSTQVSCFNGSNGKINASVSGGNSPYSYSWSNAATSQNVTGLLAGTYTLTVTDNFGCSTTKTVSISQPSNVIVTTTVTNETCNYLNNGTALALASGGTAGYTYQWQPGAVNANSLTNLASGLYTVTATDAKGCTNTAVATITEPAALTLTLSSVTDVSCYGGTDGSATVNGLGGTPNYSYTWTPGGVNSSMLNNLSTGFYSVLVSDNHGCISQKTVSVNEPAPLNLIPTISNVVCNGGSNGAISISVGGGNAPYVHNLMPGNIAGANFTNLQPGTYSIITTDAKSCVNITTLAINQPINISTSTSFTNADCSAQNGVASISVTSGGTPPFTYNWLPSGGTSSVSTSLFAGTYSVQVTDFSGCVSTKIVNINNNNAAVVTINSYTHVSCSGGSNGALDASFTGGSAPFTYSWSPVGGTALTATNLSTGLYVLQVIDNAGCIGLATSLMIAEPSPVVLSVSPSNVNCFGGNNGGASASISGGTPGYSYNWLPMAATSTSVSGLPANIYTLEITDAHTCVQTATFAVTQPAAALSISPSSASVSCFGRSDGTVTSISAGGTPPYNFNLLPGNFSGQTISNLSAGVYTVIANDLKSCSATSTITIIEPSAILLSTSSLNSNCSLANGQLSVSATGGMGSYSYTWSPAGGNAFNALNLLAGNYTVSVTDFNNCPATASETLSDNPEPVVSVASTTNVSCFGGTNGAATASVSGGTGPFTYSWIPYGGISATGSGLSTGNYSVLVGSANGCSVLAASPFISEPTQVFISVNPVAVSCFSGANGGASASVFGGTPGYTFNWQASASATSTVTGLSSGIYTVQATDANSCVQTNSFAITQPTAALSVALSSFSVSCFGGSNGSTSVSASGGTASYNFNWLPGNINGQTASNLSAGIYTLNATDANSCSATSTITIIEPSAILLSTSSVNSNCSLANGQLSVSATGGMGSYSYTWSPAGGNAFNALNLLAGNYTVSVTDLNNCPATASETLSDNPEPAVSVTSTTNVSCFGGTNGAATASVSGGTGPFTYSWIPNGGISATGSGLSTGNYSVLVGSANGCSVLAASPFISEPTQVFISVNPVAVSCFSGANGGASASVFGGTPGYTFNWQASASATSTVTGLSSGIYTVQATDANSCVQTNSFAITQPTAALSVALSSFSVSCFGGSNGSTSVSASGGTASYNFNWLPGNINGQTASNLSAGVYTLNAIDANSCSATSTITIIEPSAILLSTSSLNSNCSLANGKLSVSATGGMGSYSYTWSPAGGNAFNALNLLAGNYTVSVTDLNNCLATASETLSDNPEPVVSVTSTTNVSCFGGTNGAATASVSGGTGPFTYSWIPNGGNSISAAGLTIGSYSVAVFSANGCTVISTSSIITQPSLISANAITSSVSCFGGNNGSASLMSGGGTPGYAYTWPSGAFSNTIITGLAAGNYTININDANSCAQTVSFTIVEPVAPLGISMSSFSNVGCYNGTNGNLVVAGNGGTTPYTFNFLPYGGNAASATGLSAGSYTAGITDNNGCSTFTTLLITQPLQPLTATSVESSVSCFGGADGSAGVTAQGGTSGYSYLWSPTGNTTPSKNGLSAGSYTVKITDLNNCVTFLPVFIDQPSLLSGTLVGVNSSCGLPNGSSQSQISGGTGPYTYFWQPGSFTNTAINGLTPGTYTLQVTDLQNCKTTLTSSLINIPGPQMNIPFVKNVSCFGGNNGSATLTLNQGTAPFSVNWIPFGGSSSAAPSLLAGTYTANVTDALGCMASKTITIKEPALLNVSVSNVKEVSCYGGDNGELSVLASGGTPAYTYQWLPAHTGSTIKNLLAGSYTLNLVDANNCKLSILANVPQPAALSTSITGVSNAPCHSGTGSSTVAALGGKAPYSFSWNSNPVQTGNVLLNVISGSYTVNIKDANNCISENTVRITQPTQVVTTVTKNDTLCFGKTGILNATANGGEGDYYYTWLPGAITNSGVLTFSAASSVEYTVLAFDKNGCSGLDDASKIIVYNLSPANVFVDGLDLVCPGKSSVIEAVVYGNNGPLSFSWNNNLPPKLGPHIVTPAKATNYIVTISNSCGMSLKDSIEVKINDLPVVDFVSDTLFTCVPGIINFKDISHPVNTADPLISWTWSFNDGTFSGEQNPAHIFTEAGTFTVNLEVTTDRGCSNTNTLAPVVIVAHPQPEAAFKLNSESLDLPYDILKCTNESKGAINYMWEFGADGSSTIPDPQFLMQTLGDNKIQLIAFSQYGCSDTTFKYVNTHADIIFPSAFTPNEEGASGGAYTMSALNNDVFFPYTSGVIEYSLQIFNRWGELIFDSKDVKQGWDGYYKGKLCQVGVYVWKARATLNNGKIFNQSGNLTLLR